ncbi:hypothetical protein B5F37_10105 [Drancourtella sp. An210]|nr:hypothetical protein B5F37_10105 [Drancourtella sp. An210]
MFVLIMSFHLLYFIIPADKKRCRDSVRLILRAMEFIFSNKGQTPNAYLTMEMRTVQGVLGRIWETKSSYMEKQKILVAFREEEGII